MRCKLIAKWNDCKLSIDACETKANWTRCPPSVINVCKLKYIYNWRIYVILIGLSPAIQLCILARGRWFCTGLVVLSRDNSCEYSFVNCIRGTAQGEMKPKSQWQSSDSRYQLTYSPALGISVQGFHSKVKQYLGLSKRPITTRNVNVDVFLCPWPCSFFKEFIG